MTERIWKGPNLEPLYNPNISFGHAILSTLNRCEYQVLQISDTSGVKYTGFDLKVKTIAIAKFLQHAGIKQGDVIGIACSNSDNLAPTVFAGLLIGAPISTIEVNLKKGDIAYMFGKTKPKLVFCDVNNYAEVLEALKDLKSEAKIYTVNRKVPGIEYVEELFENQPGDSNEFLPPNLRNCAQQPAAILCSSGTTGPIKAVSVSHAQLFNQCNKDIVKSTDIFFNPNSIYWISAFWSLGLTTLMGCIRIISEENSIAPQRLVEIIEKHKVTAVLSPIYVLQSLEVDGRNLDSIRLFLTGGYHVSLANVNKINSYSKNGKVFVVYGLTEVCGVINYCYRPNTPKNSVGRADVNFQIKIINDAGECLEAEQEGEICLKTVCPFIGYYDDPQKSSEVFDSDGWLHTGDMGYFDKDGWLFIVGRKGDNFKYKGYRIAPSIIEGVIFELPAILNVCACGIWDADLSVNLPTAGVVIKNGCTITEKEIIDHVTSRLPDYMMLRGGVYFLEELPTTSTAKLRRGLATQIIGKLYNERKLSN